MENETVDEDAMKNKSLKIILAISVPVMLFIGTWYGADHFSGHYWIESRHGDWYYSRYADAFDIAETWWIWMLWVIIVTIYEALLFRVRKKQDK